MNNMLAEAQNPAAAQEAVARQTMATCPRDGTVVLLHWGEDHVSPGWWSAPCAPVQNGDGTWPSDTGGFPWAFFDLSDGHAFVNHAVDTAYGPTHWSLYAAPVAAAPGIDPDVLEKAAIELWHRWGNDSVIEWEDESHKAEYRLAAEAVLALIDVSPKGGSDAESRFAFCAKHETFPIRTEDGRNWIMFVATDPAYPNIRAAHVAATPEAAIDAAMQATSAEVGP